MRRNLLFILLTLLAYSSSFCESTGHAHIQSLFDTLRESRNDSTKLAVNQRLTDEIGKLLRQDSSFSAPFQDLFNLGKVYSDDRNVRIYSWSFPLEDKTYQYGAFVQYKSRGKVTTTPLTLQTEPYMPNEMQRLDAKHWYGCLYYKIFKVKRKKEVYYIALGWSGNNAATDFKIIEPLSFDKSGRLTTLGKAVFKGITENGKTKRATLRYIMEYNSEGKATLNYRPESNQIIFDHLMPIEPIYEGIRSYYGPDFTYDTFTQKKGEWFYEENIDARNK